MSRKISLSQPRFEIDICPCFCLKICQMRRYQKCWLMQPFWEATLPLVGFPVKKLGSRSLQTKKLHWRCAFCIVCVCCTQKKHAKAKSKNFLLRNILLPGRCTRLQFSKFNILHDMRIYFSKCWSFFAIKHDGIQCRQTMLIVEPQLILTM